VFDVRVRVCVLCGSAWDLRRIAWGCVGLRVRSFSILLLRLLFIALVGWLLFVASVFGICVLASDCVRDCLAWLCSFARQAVFTFLYRRAFDVVR
jgi:hypothetical protein